MNLFEINLRQNEFRLSTERIPACKDLATNPLVVEARTPSGKYMLAIMAVVASRHLSNQNCDRISLATLSKELNESLRVYTDANFSLPNNPAVALYGNWSKGINIVGKTFLVRDARHPSSAVIDLFGNKKAFLSKGSASNPKDMTIAIDFKAIGIELHASEIVVIPPLKMTKVRGFKATIKAVESKSAPDCALFPWEILGKICTRMTRDEVSRHLCKHGFSKEVSDRVIVALARMTSELMSDGRISINFV